MVSSSLFHICLDKIIFQYSCNVIAFQILVLLVNLTLLHPSSYLVTPFLIPLSFKLPSMTTILAVCLVFRLDITIPVICLSQELLCIQKLSSVKFPVRDLANFPTCGALTSFIIHVCEFWFLDMGSLAHFIQSYFGIVIIVPCYFHGHLYSFLI